MLLFFFVSIPLTPRSTRTDTLLPYTALSRAHIVAVGQAQMLLGRDVAEHRGAVPADHRGADAVGDMVVTRRDVGGERTERIGTEEHTSELQSLMRISYAVFCLKKKNRNKATKTLKT